MCEGVCVHVYVCAYMYICVRKSVCLGLHVFLCLCPAALGAQPQHEPSLAAPLSAYERERERESSHTISVSGVI